MDSNPHKTRLSTLIGEKVGATAPPTRSQRVMLAITDFNAMRQKMRSLVLALREHHNAMKQQLRSRAHLVECLDAMSVGGEIERHVKAVKGSGQLSFVGVHTSMAQRAEGYMQKYEEFIINYAIEWERVLTERVNEDIKRTDNHKRDYDHYVKKVNSLRSANDRNMAKGKIAKGEEIDRLERNEKKLRAAEVDYNNSSENMIILVDEVVHRGWKDLLPLMIKVAQFDATYSSDEAAQLTALNDLAVAMKATGDAYQVATKPRLRSLRLDAPADISTAVLDAQLVGAAKNLAIEDIPPPSPGSPGYTLPQSVSVQRPSSPEFSVPDDEKTQNISPITTYSEHDLKQPSSAEKEGIPTFPTIPEDQPHVEKFKAKTFASGRGHNVVMSDSSVGGGVEMSNVSVNDEYSLAEKSMGDRTFMSKLEKADEKAKSVEEIPSNDDEKSELGEFVKERKSKNPFE